MSKLQRLYAEQGQSPWLDNLTRGYLRDGTLARLVGDGIRGVTANPTIFAKAINGSVDYDEQFASLMAAGCSVDDAYWELVIADITAALAVLRPVFDGADGTDGGVSVEVAPELARDTQATVVATRRLHERIDEPNVFVKIPATAEGVAAVQAMIAEGRSINITLIFSLARYADVIDAYLAGLEEFTGGGGDPSRVHSVASFFVSRVDTEVDRRLDALGTDEALQLRGRAAVAQAKLAYRLFQQRFIGERWERLARHGVHPQLPLWASTSTKNPAYPDTRYVDELIGSDSVNTLPESTIAAFEDHGTLPRTIDTDVEEAAQVMRRLATVGVDMDDVGRTLEDEGIASFHESFHSCWPASAPRHTSSPALRWTRPLEQCSGDRRHDDRRPSWPSRPVSIFHADAPIGPATVAPTVHRAECPWSWWVRRAESPRRRGISRARWRRCPMTPELVRYAMVRIQGCHLSTQLEGVVTASGVAPPTVAAWRAKDGLGRTHHAVRATWRG